jgi:hypothetical protein
MECISKHIYLKHPHLKHPPLKNGIVFKTPTVEFAVYSKCPKLKVQDIQNAHSRMYRVFKTPTLGCQKLQNDRTVKTLSMDQKSHLPRLFLPN